jgi:TPR repeat
MAVAFARLRSPEIRLMVALVLLITAWLTVKVRAEWQPVRSVASGSVQDVSNGTLTIVTDGPAPGLNQGTKVTFVVNKDTLIFAEDRLEHIPVSDIRNYRRATVQYDLKGNTRIAVHIRLFQPIQASTGPPEVSHTAEAEAHIRRGDALYDKKDYEGAVAEYRKAISLNTNYVNAHNNLGNALDAEGKHDEAIREYREAISIMPIFALAHHNLAVTLRAKGDQAGAANENALACALDPASWCPHDKAAATHPASQAALEQAQRSCPDILMPHGPTHEVSRVECINHWLTSHGYPALDSCQARQTSCCPPSIFANESTTASCFPMPAA